MSSFNRIFVLIIFFISVLLGQESKSNKPVYETNPNYKSYINMFKLYKTTQADIVLLGNSIVHGGNWSELLGRKNVASRGIPGDVLEGFLARIDDVTKLKPKVCIIMGGINDIYAWISPEIVYKNYVKVIRKLKRKMIVPIITSTLLTGKEYPNSENRNKEVVELNELLQKYAEQYNYSYIDLNKSLSRNGFLKDEVTIDGVHLNWRGYKIWAEKIDKVLIEYGY